MSKPLGVWTMQTSQYYIKEIRFTGTGPIQWSLPERTRILIRPNLLNVNDVTISSDPTGVAGVFPLRPPAAGTSTIDQIVLTNGSGPLPLFFTGTTGESVAIWAMPCGKEAIGGY